MVNSNSAANISLNKSELRLSASVYKKIIFLCIDVYFSVLRFNSSFY